MIDKVKIILKYLFAFALLYWTIKNGHLDFSLLLESFQKGHSLILCVFTVIAQDLISCFRWKMLVQVKVKKGPSFIQFLKIHWIGLFFNSVLPGAVTGDLVKMIYARQLDDSTKLSSTFLFTTVLMDRVIGLIGLIILTGTFCFFSYASIAVTTPRALPLLHFNFLLFAGALFFTVLIFLPRHYRANILQLVQKFPFAGTPLCQFFEQVWFISGKKNLFFCTLALSLVAQSLTVLGLWAIASPFMEKALPLYYAFTFFPLGFIVIAIPISPAGLGVGHGIFDILFSYFGISGGASFFNIYFIVTISLHLLGVIPHLLNKKRPRPL